MPAVVWHGTQVESFDLLTAVSHNCACVNGVSGIRLSTCPAHTMLASDQRAIDGLLFARRLKACLVREEWSRDTHKATDWEGHYREKGT